MPPLALAVAAVALVGGALAWLRHRSSTLTLPSLPAPAPATARAELARALAIYLRTTPPTGPDERVRAYQTTAGLTPDGLYGPRTRDSLIADGITSPPEPLVGAAVEHADDPAELGRTLAIEIRTRGASYDRETCRRYQRAVRPPIAVDGVYGPETQSSLRRYGIEPPDVPGAAPAPSGAGGAQAPTTVWTPAGPMVLVTPTATGPSYTGQSTGAPGPSAPPPSSLAAELARAVAIDVRTRGRSYDRAAVAKFQASANAEGYRPPLVVDGVYGPKTRQAVITLAGLTAAPAVP